MKHYSKSIYQNLSSKKKRELFEGLNKELFGKRTFWTKLFDWAYFTCCYSWPEMARWNRD